VKIKSKLNKNSLNFEERFSKIQELIKSISEDRNSFKTLGIGTLTHAPASEEENEEEEIYVKVSYNKTLDQFTKIAPVGL
jgi:hypothetical protein